MRFFDESRRTRLSSSGYPSSRRTLLTEVTEGTLRACILASAVCMGVWLGMRPHRCNGQSPSASRRNRTVQMKSAACSGVEGVADSDVPPGYTLVNLTGIGGDCFAMFEAKDPNASPPGLGSGVADVFGPDGRLTLRFSAITRPNGQSELVEYRRLPVGEMRWLKAQR
jgi:hypothetical protein